VSSLPLIKSIKIFFATTFLPAGYPATVRPEYLEFQFWDSLQGMSSYLRGVLTTKSLLGTAKVALLLRNRNEFFLFCSWCWCRIP
jgi:hypothetical protein